MSNLNDRLQRLTNRDKGYLLINDLPKDWRRLPKSKLKKILSYAESNLHNTDKSKRSVY